MSVELYDILPTDQTAEVIASTSSVGLTGAPALRSFRNRAGDRPDLRDYNGLDMTGNNDCSDILINAVKDSGSKGFEWNVPTGTITLTKTVAVTDGSTGRFRGQGATPPIADFGLGAVPRGPGTWLHFAHPGTGVLIKGQGGSTFRNLGTYRDQPMPSKSDANAAWVPEDFGYDFEVQNTNDTLIEDVCLLNPTRGINMTDGAGRTTIRRVFGQPLLQGIRAESSYDTNRVQSTHFWPFWSLDPRVMRQTLNHAIAYSTARNDNAVWQDNFAIYYNVFLSMGYYAGNGGSRPGGSSYKFQMTNPQSDGCRYFVVVAADTAAITATITGGYHQGHTSEVPGGGIAPTMGSVLVDGSAHRISFIGTEFGNSGGSHVCVIGGANGPSYVDLVRPLLGDFDLSNQGVAGLRGPGGFIAYSFPRKTWNYNSASKTMMGVNCNADVKGDFV